MTRLNVYSEEITGDITVIERTAANNKAYWGLRVHLRSPVALIGEDRSAVTFWFESVAALNDFRAALYVNPQTARQ